MSAQQDQFRETIRAMKLALKRKADDSDSDNSIDAITNRGHKLQRRAKYVQSGHLDTTGGIQAYRKKVNHAGYTRHTIATNPNRYDSTGEDVGSDLSREGSPVEDNPFGEVQLDVILRPLTAASLLPEHPSLSHGFTSKGLTQMVDEASEMLRKERACLWKAKRLLQRFRGDTDWVPCDTFETEHDEILLYPGLVNANHHETGAELASAGESLAVERETLDGEVLAGNIEDNVLAQAESEVAEDVMNGIETADMAIQQAVAEKQPPVLSEVEHQAPIESQTNGNGASMPDEVDAATSVAGKTEEPSAQPATSVENGAEPEAASEMTSNSGKDTSDTNPPQHAMTTRARARSPVRSPSHSPSPSDSASISAIHPWYLTPSTALPDRDLGLPGQEAEESRRLLLLYVQKQENVVRSLETLYSGLQRADRVRREVWRACKAQGHMKDDGKGNWVTEMSDGEDWYDPADWGLDGRDLKVGKDGLLGLEKGKDEVDDIGDEVEGRRGPRRRRVNRM